MSHYEEIEAYGRRFAAAYHAQDATALHAIVDPDCVLMNPGEPTVVGREAVLSALTTLEHAPPLFSFPMDNYFESGDLILVAGHVVGPDSPETVSRYVVAYRRRPDGSLGLILDAPVAGP